MVQTARRGGKHGKMVQFSYCQQSLWTRISSLPNHKKETCYSHRFQDDCRSLQKKHEKTIQLVYCITVQYGPRDVGSSNCDVLVACPSTVFRNRNRTQDKKCMRSLRQVRNCNEYLPCSQDTCGRGPRGERGDRGLRS